MHKLRLSAKRKDLENFVLSLPDNFGRCGRMMYDKRNKVKLMELESGEIIVIKQFRTPRLIDKSAYLFGKRNKAIKAYDVAERLLAKGVNTPAPVSYTHLTLPTT